MCVCLCRQEVTVVFFNCSPSQLDWCSHFGYICCLRILGSTCFCRLPVWRLQIHMIIMDFFFFHMRAGDPGAQACASDTLPTRNHCSMTVKRHYDQGNFNKRKHFIGVLLTVLEAWSVSVVILTGSMEHSSWRSSYILICKQRVERKREREEKWVWVWFGDWE